MKKVSFNSEPEIYDVSGKELRIHWDIEEVSREDLDGNAETFWQASEALCNVSDVRDILIEKIIGSIYSVGSELATINNSETKPNEYAEYQAFRDQAKALADGWINIRGIQ